MIAMVDGETFEVWPEEDQAAVAPAARLPSRPPASGCARGRPGAPPGSGAPVAAPRLSSHPIPGTIVAINVKEGDTVTAGQELISLEAMKMKNSIRATRAGTIARILVKPGDRVSQGQALVEYAE